MLIRPVGRGGARGAHAHPPPPKSQKGPADGIVKDLKWYKKNVVVVGLAISMHFHAVWRPQNSNFYPGSMLPDLPKTHAECPTVPN